LLQNLGTVLNVVDVITDAHKSFLQDEEDLDTPMKVIKYFIKNFYYHLEY
jgi:hypothetical protein